MDPRLSEPHLSESSFIRTHKFGGEYHMFVNRYELGPWPQGLIYCNLILNMSTVESSKTGSLNGYAYKVNLVCITHYVIG